MPPIERSRVRLGPRHYSGNNPGKLFTPNVPLFTKQYNLVPCEGLHAKAPYCGSGIGSNEQGEYCIAVLKRFCRIVKNRDINHLLYFYFTLQVLFSGYFIIPCDLGLCPFDPKIRYLLSLPQESSLP